jgi:hypothetical protein
MILDEYQCSKTSECGNNVCFWKQRDVYGLEPFPMYFDENGDTPAMENNERIKETYGPSYFPEMGIHLATNCMTIVCKDYVEK